MIEDIAVFIHHKCECGEKWLQVVHMDIDETLTGEFRLKSIPAELATEKTFNFSGHFKDIEFNGIDIVNDGDTSRLACKGCGK